MRRSRASVRGQAPLLHRDFGGDRFGILPPDKARGFDDWCCYDRWEQCTVGRFRTREEAVEAAEIEGAKEPKPFVPPAPRLVAADPDPFEDMAPCHPPKLTISHLSLEELIELSADILIAIRRKTV